SWHFVFNCPNKQFIWKTIWEQHFDSPFSATALSRTLFNFQFPQLKQQYDPPALVILGHALASVWRHHWAMVFDHQPF
ncbi:hypothetical protein BCV71DRAFT_161772, partial [Rhizopus microsporus]